jgi:hypothetical protein
MNDQQLAGPWVRRFLLEYLVAERNLSAKAQVSGTAPADVRAEVAQGAMASCMAKKGFYPQ